jgi:cation diffusion facilitator family transporter
LAKPVPARRAPLFVSPELDAMQRFTRWLAAKTIADYRQVDHPRVRARYAALEGWVSIVLNTLLFVVKLTLGLLTHSVALVADAVHTLSDSATSVLVIIGLKIAGKPADQKHPFGHGKMEPVATLVISVLLFVIGFELLKEALSNIATPSIVEIHWGAIAIVAGTVVVKELMARFAYVIGATIDSDTLKADAAHHRSDALSTVLVLVALIGTHLGALYLDGVMGAGVALIIFYFAYGIARDAIDPLLGEAPPRETIDEIERAASGFPVVQGIHDVLYHKYGSTVDVSLRIEVSGMESAEQLHQLAEAVEEKIGRVVGGRVIVHMDPIDRDHPQYQAVSQALDEVVALCPSVKSFHELRILDEGPKRCKALFYLALKEEAPEEVAEILRCFEERFQERLPQVKPIIKFNAKLKHGS